MAPQVDDVPAGEGSKMDGSGRDTAGIVDDNEDDSPFVDDLKKISNGEGEEPFDAEEAHDAEEALVASLEISETKKQRMKKTFLSYMTAQRNYNSPNDGDIAVKATATPTPHGYSESKDEAIRAIRPGIPMVAMDSSRGLGVTLVIVYHMGYQLFKNAWWNLAIFFSLSGYLITKTTVEAYERRGHVDILKFWAKRASRLFPALLLLINVLALSQLLPYRKENHNDGVRFQREGVDLIYSTIFLTNINLVFNQVDDYFDEFTTPSITRHLWTLSIEEQYYIIWPFFMYAITYLSVGKNQQAFEEKRYLKCILSLDSCVMIGAVVSSLITIERMGTSAAYFSTLCRMGDIAIGGAVYSSTRLLPAIDSRLKAAYTDEKGRVINNEPLTMKQKLFCELCGYIGIIGVFAFSMVQIDVDDMLYFYFNGGRFFTIIFTVTITGVCIFAGEGPLPCWALACKFWCSKTLAFIGVMSYGLYLFHWPLIVFFGDPNASHRKKVALGMTEDDGSDDHYMLRDFVIWIVVIILGYISFAFYEKPCLLWSRRNKPTKTLTVGFIGMGVTLLTIWAVTKDLPPRMSFENDANNLFDGANDLGPIPVDDRYTPVLSTLESRAFYESLDFNARSEYRDLHGDGAMEHMLDLYSTQYKPGGELGANSTVLIKCVTKAANRIDVCASEYHFVQPSYLIHVKSDYCGYRSHEIALNVEDSCPHKVTQIGLEYSSTHGIIKASELDAEENHLEVKRITLEIDELIPGVLNQKSMYLLRKSLSTNYSSSEPFNPISFTIIGESVAERIGMFWKDSMNQDIPPAIEGTGFPESELFNLGFASHAAISYFLCIEHYDEYPTCAGYDPDDRTTAGPDPDDDVPAKVMQAFKLTQPDIILIHDTHWTEFGNRVFLLETLYDRVLAFNSMAIEGMENGAQGIVFLTQSLKSSSLNNHDIYRNEMIFFLDMVEILGCSQDDEGSIRLTLVNWAELTCPEIARGSKKCNQAQHGFPDILPDDSHPFGESGLWLTRLSLALAYEDIVMSFLPEEFHTQVPFTNFASAALLDLAPPDDDPPLEELLFSYYVCPHRNFEEIKDKANKINPKKSDSNQINDKRVSFSESDYLVTEYKRRF